MPVKNLDLKTKICQRAKCGIKQFPFIVQNERIKKTTQRVVKMFTYVVPYENVYSVTLNVTPNFFFSEKAFV